MQRGFAALTIMVVCFGLSPVAHAHNFYLFRPELAERGWGPVPFAAGLWLHSPLAWSPLIAGQIQPLAVGDLLQDCALDPFSGADFDASYLVGVWDPASDPDASFLELGGDAHGPCMPADSGWGD